MAVIQLYRIYLSSSFLTWQLYHVTILYLLEHPMADVLFRTAMKEMPFINYNFSS